VRGKWSKGIEPRNFGWIIKDRLAFCERPGGQSANHRRVRRHEEIIWIKEHGFSRVISIMISPHNLHAYEELGVTYSHVPVGAHDDLKLLLAENFYPQLRLWLAHGEKILIHGDEIGDRLQGVLGGYLRWTGMIPAGPTAITAIETLMRRQLGTPGREIVTLANPPVAPPAA
jgi:hypothetical protein